MLHTRFRRRRRLCALLAAWLAVAGAAAADTPADTTAKQLTLPQVLARVLRDSPELAAYPHRLRAAESRERQAGLWPNPELSAGVENVYGDGAFAGTDSAESSLVLSQVIEMGGKRGYRRDVARLGGEVVQDEYRLARLDALSRAARRFLEVARVQRLLALNKAVAEWTRQAEAAVQARFNAGSAGRAELSQARIAAMRAGLTVEKAANHLENARLKLASRWGATKADFSGVRADLFALPDVPPFDKLRSRLEQAPSLQRYLTLERLRRAEVDLAEARGDQDITVGVGMKQVEPTGDRGWTLQLSMPLGVSNRNQGNIEAARAERQRLDSERAAARTRLYTELHRHHNRLEQARRTVELLRDRAQPEAEQALRQIQQGYRGGRFSYLQLVEARRQRLAVERDAIEAAVEFHRALILLEQLTGTSLTATPHSIVRNGPAGEANRIKDNPQ